MPRTKHGSSKSTDTLLTTNVDLATADVTGILPTAGGGTGTGAPVAGDLLVGAVSNLWARKSLVKAGAILRTNAAATDVEWWQLQTTAFLSADNAAIAAAAPTTVLPVAGLSVAVAVGEEWEAEWVLHLANSVASDVFAFNVNASAGTFTGRYTVTGANGVPTTGAAVAKFIQQACGTLTTASTNAPGATGTIGLITTVIIRAQGIQSVAPGNLQVSLRAGTSAAASSGTATVKAHSRMLATRLT